MNAKFINILGKVPAVSHLLRWIARQYPEGSVTRIRTGYAKGALWKRYHRYVSGYWWGNYELKLQSQLVSELKPGDIFIDVGANAGFFSLIASRLVGPEGKCLSLDPDPANITSIVSQKHMNDLKNWIPLEKAVSSSSGSAAFYFDKPGDSTSSLEGRDGDDGIRVNVTTLDEITEQYGNPDLIKMDIEGHEYKALLGGEKVIANVRPKLLIELHSEEIAQKVITHLNSHQYQIYNLDGKPYEWDSSHANHILALPI